MANQATLLPVRANWAAGVQTTFEFRTDTPFVARSGRESSRRILRTTPRVALEFDALTTRDPMRNAARFLSNRLNEVSYVINPIEYVHTLTDLDAADDTVAVDDVPYWLVGDGYAIIGNGDYFELFQVAGVIDPNVTFNAVSAGSWPAGSRLYKAEFARIGTTKSSMATRGTGVLGIKADVDPATTILPPVGAAGEMFDSRELFLKRPNLSEPFDVEFLQNAELVDYGSGVVVSYSPSKLLSRDYKATYLGRDTAEVWEIIDLFRRMYGRAGEFYAPTGTVDLKPIATLASGTAILTTAGLADYNAYFDTTVASSRLVNKAVLVALRDGTHVARKISTVTSVGGNTRFTMTANWSSSITLANIKYVSYLPLCRFGSDSLTIEWLTRSVAQFNLSFHTLESLAPDA